MKKIIYALILISTVSIANAQLDIPLPRVVRDPAAGGATFETYNRLSQSQNDLRRQRLEIQQLQQQNQYREEEENERLLLIRQQRKLIEMQIEAMQQKTGKVRPNPQNKY
jgi:hypothetical protein